MILLISANYQGDIMNTKMTDKVKQLDDGKIVPLIYD